MGGDRVTVLLVHGLGRTPGSLFGLAAALRRAGHRTHFFAYSPTLESLSRIVRRLAQRIAELGPGLGLIGHSLGGVLLRLALARCDSSINHRLVLLGSPARSPRLARVAFRSALFRWLTGDCGTLLADAQAMDNLPRLVGRATVIAGTAGRAGSVLMAQTTALSPSVK